MRLSGEKNDACTGGSIKSRPRLIQRNGALRAQSQALQIYQKIEFAFFVAVTQRLFSLPKKKKCGVSLVMLVTKTKLVWCKVRPNLMFEADAAKRRAVSYWVRAPRRSTRR